jgi:PKD repeat protein
VNLTDFSKDADGTIASYRWEFGDGTSSTEANPPHTYSAAGTYLVTLRVIDNQGRPHSRTRSVIVP